MGVTGYRISFMRHPYEMAKGFAGFLVIPPSSQRYVFARGRGKGAVPAKYSQEREIDTEHGEVMGGRAEKLVFRLH